MKMKRITSGLLSLVMTVGLLLPGVQATERLDTAASSEGGEETARYLCDMEWESATLGTGMYEIEVDKECDGKPLQLEGEEGAAVNYEHGIGTHANSEIIYNIEGLNATRFTCDYGASKSKADSDGRTSVTFQIYVDDEEMLNDSTVYKKSVAHGTADIAIPEDAKTLKLVVGNSGNSAADHANWADPKLYTKALEGEHTLSAQTEKGSLSVGDTAQITVSVTNPAGETVDLSRTEITYQTESGTVTVTDEGLVTGVAAGTAEITVSAEIAGKTLTDTVTITVTVNSQAADGFVYLCDMDWESATVSTSTGVTVAHTDFEGGDLRLEGAESAYEHGIGTHAKSEIIYDIGGIEATRFTCDYGASKTKADATNQTSVTFQIYVDGVELLNDSTVYKKDIDHGTADIEIPAGAKTLKLMVGDGGNGIGSDHANWSDPKLYMENPDQKVTLSVSMDKAIMLINDTAQILVSADNLIGEAVDLSKSKISYTTDSEAVTVTDNGVVTGVSSGTAEITVSVEIAGKVFSDKVSIKVWSAEEQEKYNLLETVAARTDAENGPQITFVLEDGKPYYLVKYAGSERIEKSELGMEIDVNGEEIALKDGFVVVETVRSSGDETWSPVVGETSEIRDYYHQSTVTLEHEASNLRLTVELRAYDTGTAFRYVLPEVPEGQESYKITNERTYFEFPSGAYTAYGYKGANQVHADKITNGAFATNEDYRRPMTLLYTDGTAMTICEAKLDNYAVMELRTPEKNALKATYSQVMIEKDHPGVTPWRTFVLAENENGLQQNSSIVMNLNDPADEETYHFSEWVEAGSCLRVYRSKPGKTNSDLSMEAILKSIDLAAADDIPYISLDTGWYGPENDVRVDPRLDPTLIPEDSKLGNYVTKEGCFTTNGKPFNVFGSLEDLEKDNLPVSVKYIYTDVNIPDMCKYAEEKGVGVILYVNKRHLQKVGENGYTVDELFERLASWGVSGVKPGFVNYNTQEAEAFVQEVIEAAAKHRLVMTIHDEWVPTGTERTFPNMLTAEGIRGDESMAGSGNAKEIGYGDLRSLFARTVQGTADHTFCYPGKGTKVYALASPLMFRTGLNFLYWFTAPDQVPEADQGKMGFWKGLPATWDETLYLEGKMDQYATYARRNGERWWLGSLTDNARALTVELDFLEAGKKYVADIYADEAASKNIENIQYIVGSTTTLERDLKEHGGYAVKFAVATQEEINTLPWYGTTPYTISVNEVEGGTANVQVNGKAGADELVTIVIADVEDGKQVKTVAVTGADGTPVDATKTAEGYTFTMPAQDVSVSVVLEAETDKTPIDKAIVEAEAAKAGIIVNDGNPSDVSSGTKFVTTEVMKALDDAILAAKDAKETAMTEQDVTDAVKALTDAVAVFTDAVQTGSNVPSYTPSSNTPSKTEKNEDGSTTKTVTNKTTGTVTETTTWPNGDKTVVVTKKDGTVTTTATKKDGLKTETVTTPDGETTAEVTLPKDTESAQVTIPVEDPGPGTVAVIIREDGTEEIIKTSVATEDGIRFTAKESAAVKLIDNSKHFDDVADNHWAADAVQFVTSRELFDGTGKERFSPMMDMSRAMLVTVLARLDGVDTTGGESWYSKAIDWGMESGITDGTNANASITRESLVVMLYRYAGEPTAEGEAETFTDSDSISGWAVDALDWAIKTGIINGKNGNILDPQGTATRAEVAAMLMRFVAAVQ